MPDQILKVEDDTATPHNLGEELSTAAGTFGLRTVDPDARELLVSIQRGEGDQDRRFEFQDVGGTNKPLYIGVAPPATATSGSWAIEKYTFAAGPAGGSVPTLIQTRVGAWDDRATLF